MTDAGGELGGHRNLYRHRLAIVMLVVFIVLISFALDGGRGVGHASWAIGLEDSFMKR